jgi:outer membrane murein-binding lipoprotein Lpp
MADYSDLCERLRQGIELSDSLKGCEEASINLRTILSAIEALVAEVERLQIGMEHMTAQRNAAMRDYAAMKVHADIAESELSALREWKAKVLAQTKFDLEYDSSCEEGSYRSMIEREDGDWIETPEP